MAAAQQPGIPTCGRSASVVGGFEEGQQVTVRIAGLAQGTKTNFTNSILKVALLKGGAIAL